MTDHVVWFRCPVAQYAILPGNNSRLLKVCFRHRAGWTPTSSDAPTEGYNFMYVVRVPVPVSLLVMVLVLVLRSVQ